MGCLNSDGSLTGSARLLLLNLEVPRLPEELPAQTGIPLFRIRGALRELGAAGLVQAEAERFVLTDSGRMVLTLDS